MTAGVKKMLSKEKEIAKLFVCWSIYILTIAFGRDVYIMTEQPHPRNKWPKLDFHVGCLIRMPPACLSLKVFSLGYGQWECLGISRN